MPSLHDVLIIQLAATGFMTGLIWFVQVVHYPLMAAVGRDEWVGYEQAHTRLMSYVVAPGMLLEVLASAFVLYSALQQPDVISVALVVAATILLAGIWASTFFIQVPLHRALSEDHDPQRIATLVQTNWIRTLLWTTRLVLCALMF